MTDEEIQQILERFEIKSDSHKMWLMIAIKMINHSIPFDDEFIAKITEMSANQIKELRKKVGFVKSNGTSKKPFINY